MEVHVPFHLLFLLPALVAAEPAATAPTRFDAEPPDAWTDPAVQAAFAAARTGSEPWRATLVHDPALDRVATDLARRRLTGEPDPTTPLIAWTGWREGSSATVRGAFVVEVSGSVGRAERVDPFEDLGSMLDPTSTEARVGAALVHDGKRHAWCVVVGDHRLDPGDLPPQLPTGTTYRWHGRFLVPGSDPRVYLDQPGREVWSRSLSVAPDGTFEVDLPTPERPGRYFLEVAATPAGTDLRDTWILVPLDVGQAAPARPDLWMREPEDPSVPVQDWPARTMDAWNRLRTKEGLPTLTADVRVTTLAEGWTASVARTGDMGEMPDVAARLPAEGIPVEDLQQRLTTASSLQSFVEWGLLSPSHRAFLLDPAVRFAGVGFAPSPAYAGTVWASSILVAPVPPLDPAMENARIRTDLSGYRVGRSLWPFREDASTQAAFQAFALEACAGRSTPTAEALRRHLDRQGWTPSSPAADLQVRIIAGSHPATRILDHLGDPDPFLGDTARDTLAIGSCQGSLPGLAGGQLVVLGVLGTP